MKTIYSQNTARESFDLAIEELLKTPENKDYISLYFFIKRLRKQYKVFCKTTDDVFSETYIRSIRYIEEREEHIERPYAFMRDIARKIVLEMSRQDKRLLSCDQLEQILADETVNFLPYEDFSSAQVEKLKSELQKLKPQERNTIYWWKIYRYSWKEIVEKLAIYGETTSVSTARQRGKRLWNKLAKSVKEVEGN